MFGPAYFGTTHYAPTYFPPDGDIIELPAEQPGIGGGSWPGIGGQKKKYDDTEEWIMMVIKEFLKREG